MAGELSESVDQFLRSAAIPQEDQRVCCGICHEPYTTGHQPVEISGCKHIFGKTCITSWLEAGNDTCPMCRQKILNHPVVPSDDDDVSSDDDDDWFWLPRLSGWRAGYAMEQEPGELTRHGEILFINLCEDIIRYIEDPSVDNAEDWLCGRSAFRYIVALGSFERFAEVIKGPMIYVQSLARRIPEVLPDPAAYHAVMAQVDRLPDHVGFDGRMDNTVEAFDRLAGFYRRINNSRDALYERLRT